MQGHIADAHPGDVGAVWWYRELPWICSAFRADVTRHASDATIKVKAQLCLTGSAVYLGLKALNDLVAPSCDSLNNTSASWLFTDYLQRQCEQFADEPGFNGGSSNRLVS